MSAAAARRGRSVSALWRRLPWWAQVTVVFLGGRAVSTALLLALASVEGQNAWTAAHPGYFDFANIWDGRWYELVAYNGYPSQLPYDATGHVSQNAWAFLPAYPWAVRGVIWATGLSWPVAAVDVTLLFAYAATLMFYRLMRLKLKPSVSLYATVLFSVAPVAALFQLAYAESMYAFLLAAMLYLLVKRRYLTTIPVAVIAAYTRPSGLAVALLLGLLFVWRWWIRRRDPFRVGEAVRLGAATLVALAAGASWPIIAARVTGVPSAYTDTELSWRSSYVGYSELRPFSAWFEGARWWFTDWLRLPEWLAYTAVVVLAAAFALALFLPAVKRLGVEMRLWLASYGVYLFAVFFPQSSTFRLLLPMFPLLGALALPRSRAYRVVAVVVSVALQLGWLLICWIIGGYDWSPP